MKKILLLLLCNISLVYGQQYISCFGDTHSKWTEIVQNEYPMSWELEVIGDTTINNLKYKDVIWGYALRQDSTNSKLYMLSYESNEEYVIMDLNLAKGDSFELKNPYLETKYIVVDSVYSENGRKIIQFDYSKVFLYYTYEYEKFKFIEGIGSNMGITYQFDISMFDHPYLLCYQNDTVSYRSPFFESCDYVYDVGLSDSQYQNYKITNTVTHDFVKIQVFDNERYTLTILDLNGKVISNTKIIENETIIDMKLFKQGIYVFKLIDSSGMINSQKIVKQ